MFPFQLMAFIQKAIPTLLDSKKLADSKRSQKFSLFQHHCTTSTGCLRSKAWKCFACWLGPVGACRSHPGSPDQRGGPGLREFRLQMDGMVEASRCDWCLFSSVLEVSWQVCYILSGICFLLASSHLQQDGKITTI